jgi:hypothetical protein
MNVFTVFGILRMTRFNFMRSDPWLMNIGLQDVGVGEDQVLMSMIMPCGVLITIISGFLESDCYPVIDYLSNDSTTYINIVFHILNRL